MGWFGSKPRKGSIAPAPGVPVRTPGEVYAALLATHRPPSRYVVRPGGPEAVDLVAEWRIDDPRGPRHHITFQVLMRLDPARHEVRAVDQLRKETHLADDVHLPVNRELQRGRSSRRNRSWTLDFGRGKPVSLTPDHDVSSDGLRIPLRDTVLAGGWTWRTLGAFESC